MTNMVVKNLPWIVPAVAILVVGTGQLDKLGNALMSSDQSAATRLSVSTPAEAPVVVATAVAEAAPEPDPSAALQLAAILTDPQPAATDAVDDLATRAATSLATAPLDLTAGAAVNTGEVEPVAVAAEPAIQEPAVQQPVTEAAADAAFFNAAQANLASARSCVDDLRDLAERVRVYFPAGGVTGEEHGIGKARIIGLLAQECPGVSIQVQGHSDPSGDPNANLRLSQQRAEAVISRISASGVDTSKFVARGLGSAVPSRIDGPESRAYYDRRVEFTVIEQTQQTSFTPRSGVTLASWQSAACVGQLEQAVAQTKAFYTPGSVILSDADMTAALRVAALASSCPQARLRIIGQHADEFGSAETPATGRLRARALMARLEGEGIDPSQIIIAAPSDSRPIPGLSNSRVDFDFILEEF